LVKISKPELKRHFLINKSAALNSIGRYSESIMLLEAEAIHFEEAKMYKNLADAYYFVGINEKCQYNYEKAIRMNPRLDEAMYNLAACIFAQGNFYIADIWIAKAL
jgi:tetratricopeptide (TPR) repeat protein